MFSFLRTLEEGGGLQDELRQQGGSAKDETLHDTIPRGTDGKQKQGKQIHGSRLTTHAAGPLTTAATPKEEEQTPSFKEASPTSHDRTQQPQTHDVPTYFYPYFSRYPHSCSIALLLHQGRLPPLTRSHSPLPTSTKSDTPPHIIARFALLSNLAISSTQSPHAPPSRPSFFLLLYHHLFIFFPRTGP